LNRSVARVFSNLYEMLRVGRLGKLPIPCNHVRISYLQLPKLDLALPKRNGRAILLVSLSTVTQRNDANHPEFRVAARAGYTYGY
jgi:hypothetical protein